MSAWHPVPDEPGGRPGPVKWWVNLDVIAELRVRRQGQTPMFQLLATTLTGAELVIAWGVLEYCAAIGAELVERAGATPRR